MNLLDSGLSEQHIEWTYLMDSQYITTALLAVVPCGEFAMEVIQFD